MQEKFGEFTSAWGFQIRWRPVSCAGWLQPDEALCLAVWLAQASKAESCWCRSLTGLHCGFNIQARPHLSLCLFVQGKESERGMRTKCHGRERACYFSSHAPVEQTKTNIAIGQQQHSHRVKAWKNQSKQHSAPPLTLGQSLIVLCRIRGSFLQMLFMPQSCSPPLDRPSILLLHIYMYSQQKQTEFMTQTNNHSNNQI